MAEESRTFEALKPLSKYVDEDWSKVSNTDGSGPSGAYDDYCSSASDPFLANAILGGGRFVRNRQFLKHVSETLDKRFTHAEDKRVRDRLDGFVDELKTTTKWLRRYRTIAALVLSFAAISLGLADGVDFSLLAGKVESLTLAPEKITFQAIQSWVFTQGGIAILAAGVVHWFVWVAITASSYRKYDEACTNFGNDYQQKIVSPLQLSLATIPSAVNEALLRNAPSVARTMIGQLSVASIWIPLRVDYYEQALQFRFWQSVYEDARANVWYRLLFAVLFFALIAFAGAVKDSSNSAALVLTAIWINIFGATLAFVPGGFADRRGWIVGGPQQLKQALGYKSWKRAANLYKEVVPRKVAEGLVDQYSNANVIKHKQLNRGQQPFGEPGDPA